MPATTVYLTPAQRRVLTFCRAERNAGRDFPTRAAIIAHMGWLNPSSATSCLQNLSAKGFMTRHHTVGKRRGYTFALAFDIPGRVR